MKPIPPELRRDPGWRAALVIIESPWFADRGAVWNHVHPERGSLFFDQILAAIPWSSTERLMLEAAASLFNGDTKISLYHTLSRIDDLQLRVLLRAVAVFLGEDLGRLL